MDKVEQSPIEKFLGVKRERRPSCTLCSNHGVRSNLKGHKHQCPFLTCHCELCIKGRRKRDIMKQQVRLRRKQMKEIGSRPYCVTPLDTGKVDISPKPVKTESSASELENNNSLCRDRDERDPVLKMGGFNGGLTQSVSSILQSSFVPRRQPFSCSPYIPTPYQLWTIGDGRVVSGFHYNNSPEQIMSPRPSENSPSHGFSVSDNSAFVKYCGQPPRFEDVSFRFGSRSSSAEAAVVLASFGNPESATSK